jgi:Uma2 family endonuclease
MGVVAAPSETKLITGEELLAMGDIGPCELIDGRIVPMSPTGFEHGNIEVNLSLALKAFAQQRKLGWVVSGEVGIYTRRHPDRVRGADVVFASKERLPKLPEGFLQVAPELVVEIISPTDRWSDMRRKIDEYFAIGAQRVWVVEPENRTVLVYRSRNEMSELTEDDTLVGEGALEGFSLPVASLFAE